MISGSARDNKLVKSSEEQLLADARTKMAAKQGFVIQSSTTERSKQDFHKGGIQGRFQKMEARKKGTTSWRVEVKRALP